VLLAHADWSVDARKRWVTFARPLPNGRFETGAPVPVGPLPSFFDRLREMEPTGPIFAGFDFPIGLPRAYAARAGVTSFLEALCLFGSGDWRDFYEPAESPAQVSITRPFYPKRPGGASKKHLIGGIGVESTSDLLRVCDRATKACELFWTLGANQVGRAASVGWRDLLAPAVLEGTVSLWPFQGELCDLLQIGATVVAETYPAETYGHIEIERGFGKRDQTARQNQAAAIIEWCDARSVQLRAAARRDIEAGFGSFADGEDRFDSFIGLLGMIEVVACPDEALAPLDALPVEGWILGMGANRSLTVPAPGPRPEGAVVASKVCPACGRKTFLHWPWGWDGHAAYKCAGIEGTTPEDRKRAFKARYLS
jgi:hypothetical protein